MSRSFYLCKLKFYLNMASTYSLALLLLGMMMVTTVVGAGRSNMFGYPDQNPVDPEDDFLDLLYDPAEVKARPPPIYYDPELDWSDFDSILRNFSPIVFIVNLYQ